MTTTQQPCKAALPCPLRISRTQSRQYKVALGKTRYETRCFCARQRNQRSLTSSRSKSSMSAKFCHKRFAFHMSLSSCPTSQLPSGQNQGLRGWPSEHAFVVLSRRMDALPASEFCSHITRFTPSNHLNSGDEGSSVMRINRSARDVFDQRLSARVIERKLLPLELLLRYAS